ncbi:3'-5' exonuclease [Campylobacter lari]|nr:3'-5' exonuclease [Campylobacter lari]MCV3487578.1 3'-5' exonuclease [Campylobacter lari]MCV3493596.1 3'-5' exonuclease [Campylobacter lari]MCV3502724.1 3'-5' exonuclease [Campylobacter lari]MCV3532542.1 3'-5' exonuclease [Campylobacter lari]
MQEYICVFDCESIPDVELIKHLYDFNGDDLSISKQALERQKEESGSEFLPLPFHKVVSICAVIADKFGNFIKVNKIKGENEKQMLEEFFNFIDKHQPRLVSFNGKSYDMPLLVIRALKYNINASAYLDASDKWNNYKSKFVENKHCDLLESLGSFGQKGLRLDTLCAMAGLPGKYDVHGNEVLDLFYQNKLEKIHEYCESDVLNTYMLFLKYEFIKGNLTREDYLNILENFKEELVQKHSDKSYQKPFLEAIEKEKSKF